MVDWNSSFDWHRYVHLDIRDLAYEKLVIAAFDQIASTPEGQQLLIRGSANLAKSQSMLAEIKDPALRPRADNKIAVYDVAPFPELEGRGSFDSSVLGSILLDQKQIGKIGYKRPDGSWQPMNLTEIAFHELFHQADPNLAFVTFSKNMTQSRADLLNEYLEVKSLGDVTQDALLKTRIMSTGSQLLAAKEFPDFMAMDEMQQAKYLMVPANAQKLMAFSLDVLAHPERMNAIKSEIAVKLNIPEASFQFHAVDVNQFVKKEQANATDPVTHAPIIEESATIYTDAWTQKYFAEAPRGEYMRAAMLDEKLAETPLIRPFSCGAEPHLAFRNIDPATLGDMPTMSSIPCLAVVQVVQQGK